MRKSNVNIDEIYTNTELKDIYLVSDNIDQIIPKLHDKLSNAAIKQKINVDNALLKSIGFFKICYNCVYPLFELTYGEIKSKFHQDPVSPQRKYFYIGNHSSVEKCNSPLLTSPATLESKYKYASALLETEMDRILKLEQELKSLVEKKSDITSYMKLIKNQKSIEDIVGELVQKLKNDEIDTKEFRDSIHLIHNPPF